MGSSEYKAQLHRRETQEMRALMTLSEEDTCRSIPATVDHSKMLPHTYAGMFQLHGDRFGPTRKFVLEGRKNCLAAFGLFANEIVEFDIAPNNIMLDIQFVVDQSMEPLQI